MLGIAVDGRGRVYACDAGNGEVARWDPGDGPRSRPTRAGSAARPWTVPTWPPSDPTGRSTSRVRARTAGPEILRVRPGGGDVERWTDAVPALPERRRSSTPDGSALIVVEAQEQRVVRVPIDEPDGSAGPVSVIADLPDTDPDGVALDADGSLWVTLYRPDGLVRIDPTAAVELVVDDHLAQTFDAPTNIAWVGDGARPRSRRQRRRHVPLDRRPGGRGDAPAPTRRSTDPRAGFHPDAVVPVDCRQLGIHAR